MYRLVIENEFGARLIFGETEPFAIVEIEGLAPPEAVININELALLDGGRFNSAHLQTRQLNIAFAIQFDAEKNRLEAYKVLRVKRKVRVYYESELRNVYIEGYIQTVDVAHFDAMQTCTVSIICPRPYWIGAQEIINELSYITDMFHFPFASTASPEITFGEEVRTTNVTVINAGEAVTGMTITALFNGSVDDLKIVDYANNHYFGVEYAFVSGDELTITTISGNKTVTLLRGGTRYNLFNYIMDGSEWLQMEPGENTYIYEVTSGLDTNVSVTFTHEDLFEGV